jgi:hypothetical protein
LEPGYQKTDFINAITRAAHSQSWPTAEAADHLEDRAGALLFQRVWNVAIEAEEGVVV